MYYDEVPHDDGAIIVHILSAKRARPSATRFSYGPVAGFLAKHDGVLSGLVGRQSTPSFGYIIISLLLYNYVAYYVESRVQAMGR